MMDLQVLDWTGFEQRLFQYINSIYKSKLIQSENVEEIDSEERALQKELVLTTKEIILFNKSNFIYRFFYPWFQEAYQVESIYQIIYSLQSTNFIIQFNTGKNLNINTLHRNELIDNAIWLREKNNPELNPVKMYFIDEADIFQFLQNDCFLLKKVKENNIKEVTSKNLYEFLLNQAQFYFDSIQNLEIIVNKTGNLIKEDDFVIKNFYWQNQKKAVLFIQSKNNSEQYVVNSYSNISQYSPEVVQQIKEQLISWSKINEKDIYSVNFAYITRDNLFVAWNYLNGTPLQEYIFQEGIINETIIWQYIREIIIIINNCHKNNLIIKTIQPSNIFIDSNFQIKISFLGIDYFIEKNSTTYFYQQLKWYLSPEIIRNQIIDERTDVWFLGVFLFEIYVKTNPFSKEEIEENYQKFIHQRFTMSKDFNISKELRNFIQKCLRFDPEQWMHNKDVEILLDHPWFTETVLTQYDADLKDNLSDEIDELTLDISQQDVNAFRNLVHFVKEN